MLDNQLIQLFLPIIQQGLITLSVDYPSLADVGIRQSYQPVQVGTPSAATVFFHKLFDNTNGFRSRKDVYDSDLDQMIHTEIQQYETTFQVDALSAQDPTDPNQLTASDIVNFVGQILQSSDTIEQLNSVNVGVYRIGEIRNPYFTDDRGQFEASPSFDFTLIHSQIVSSVIEGTDTAKGTVNTV